jgi:hypothetical protein
MKFMKGVVNVVEGLSIILFFIFFCLAEFTNESVNDRTFYFFQRIFSFFKVFSLIRSTSLSWRLKTVPKALRSSASELFLAVFYLLVSILISSNLMYYVEEIHYQMLGEVEKTRPRTFDSAFKAMWWAVVTMTTVILPIFFAT